MATIDAATGCLIEQMLLGKSIHSTAVVDLFGFDLEPELLLQRTSNGASHCVWLPRQRLDDLGDGGAIPATRCLM